MKQFHFWQQWLFYSSLLFAAAGILFALNGNSPVFEHYNRALTHSFWRSDIFPAEVQRFRAHTWGSLGGTIACCYILLAFIAFYPFRKRETWSWYSIAAAFSVWFVIDCAVCIYYKFYFQLWVVNLFSFMVKALPLIFTAKYFFNKK